MSKALVIGSTVCDIMVYRLIVYQVGKVTPISMSRLGLLEGVPLMSLQCFML